MAGNIWMKMINGNQPIKGLPFGMIPEKMHLNHLLFQQFQTLSDLHFFYGCFDYLLICIFIDTFVIDFYSNKFCFILYVLKNSPRIHPQLSPKSYPSKTMITSKFLKKTPIAIGKTDGIIILQEFRKNLPSAFAEFAYPWWIPVEKYQMALEFFKNAWRIPIRV